MMLALGAPVEEDDSFSMSQRIRSARVTSTRGLSLSFLRKYIQFEGRINPTLSQEARDRVASALR